MDIPQNHTRWPHLPPPCTGLAMVGTLTLASCLAPVFWHLIPRNDWTLQTDHLRMLLVGIIVGAMMLCTAVLERKGRSMDEAYQLGFDLGYERGFRDGCRETVGHDPRRHGPTAV